ncbi:leucine-rich repeat neuronal protein 3 [Scaptodrosophila lebanonensis]|uniref:Leucine-rich repeat neuronal protein 3 n=1 Tax=Drosophila lebanonensis TaxID=7225 RepID=A0A6J2U702_DROLE|nr:leucine-rich repeat neuronal protein 3 [Scaptodrosophila lebanonensis]
MKISRSKYIILACFMVIIPKGHLIDGSDANTTLSTDAPQINVTKTQICTKCTCDVDNSLIDCTAKLKGWFSEAEWKLLQNGGVIFETMKLEHNNLTNIPKLPTYGVKNLYLGFNEIETIETGAFQNLTQLTILDLSHNKITSKSLVPDVFKGSYSPSDYEPLANLKSLNLGYNDLHTLNDDLFEHAPFIEELVLCSNTFQTIDKLTETALSGLAHLKTLDISYMEINSLPDTLLHGPRDLETLIAVGNLFTELPKTLSSAVNLKSLTLDENPIQNLENKNVFPELKYLKYLSLSYMPELYKIGKGALSSLQNLTELILSDNGRLAEIDSLALANDVKNGNFYEYPPLEKVYLNSCNLTSLPRSLLVRWDKLDVIDLRFNPWNCDFSNNWMSTILLPQINKTNPILANNVECRSPKELIGVPVIRANSIDNSSHGALFWLVILVITAIPTAYLGFIIYRRGCFGYRTRGDTSHRALYDRASFTDDFHI